MVPVITLKVSEPVAAVRNAISILFQEQHDISRAGMRVRVQSVYK